MEYDKALIDIVKKKKFKTFWHCLDYFLLAGYTPLDAFGISLLEFGEGRIYSDVSFIRVNNGNQIMEMQNGVYTPRVISTFSIGLLDETNIHLSGLYNTYRKWLSEDTIIMQNTTETEELENTCEIIKLNTLTPFIIEYLHGVSKKHYGYEAFIKPIFDNRVMDANGNHFTPEYGQPHSPRQNLPPIMTRR